MSVNNDLDSFYEKSKGGNPVYNEHAMYSFLLTLLTRDEIRQFLKKDPKLLNTLHYEPNFASLTQSTLENKLNRYIYYLCQRQTVNLKLAEKEFIDDYQESKV